jgi:hypothetical protein
MTFWQVKTRPETPIRWGRCELQAVLSTQFSAYVYLVEADEPDAQELKQRYPEIIVERARDGTYRDQETGASFRLSADGTQCERMSPP